MAIVDPNIPIGPKPPLSLKTTAARLLQRRVVENPYWPRSRRTPFEQLWRSHCNGCSGSRERSLPQVHRAPLYAARFLRVRAAFFAEAERSDSLTTLNALSKK